MVTFGMLSYRDEMIKVIIADDQVLLRESIGHILNNDEEIEVITTVANGQACLDICKKYKPDIILMDIEMPVMNGVKATKLIKEAYPEIKIIILTTFEDSDNIMESFMVGADGYIVKDISHYDLVLTVKCVSRGLTIIHESVKKIMISRFKGLLNYKTQYENKLSKREIEICKLIATGKSNKQIAYILNYSEGTIKNKISKIFEKLELSDRMQVAIFAIENGLMD